MKSTLKTFLAVVLLTLREQVQAASGPDFSLPAFHDLVLLNGSVPLDFLEMKVDKSIEAQK